MTRLAEPSLGEYPSLGAYDIPPHAVAALSLTAHAVVISFEPALYTFISFTTNSLGHVTQVQS